MSFDNGGNGNPPARPRRAWAAPTLDERDLEAILRKVVERAKQGNLAAARLCLDLLGRRRRSEWNRPRPLVPHETPFNFTSVMRDIREKVAAGELTTGRAPRNRDASVPAGRECGQPHGSQAQDSRGSRWRRAATRIQGSALVRVARMSRATSGEQRSSGCVARAMHQTSHTFGVNNDSRGEIRGESHVAS